MRKIFRLTDMRLNHDLFQMISAVWGPFSIDLFATFEDRQLQRFASALPQPDGIWVDAMKHSWVGERPWANPPFALISRVLQKVRIEETTVVLVAPLWPAQPWFASLMGMLAGVPIILPRSSQLFQHPLARDGESSANIGLPSFGGYPETPPREEGSGGNYRGFALGMGGEH